ncbi:RNA-binding protein 2-like isoform X1 [Corylus avellana]|uniref:RNA-binding protein 2-like isoform X1 n=1 Tax=Corylus avellana TaxID=13451 RepID=UPI00286A3411|nr:RNA-binding protein 2-like isoform X1 [Corylus avellana]
MADPYYRYSASEDRVSSVARPSFPGYLSAEAPPLPSYPNLGSTNLLAASSNFLQKDVQINSLQPGAYHFDDISGAGARPDPGLGGVTAVASTNGFPSPLEDPNQRRDVAPGVSPGIRSMSNEIPSSLRSGDGFPVPARESNVLFVDKLPNDCTRREVGHLFRPFIGYKDIKVIHREPRRSGDKAKVLCFVEFADSKCALTALEAIQGYKFDDKKPDSSALSIQFAHFPFRQPSDHDEERNAVPR